MPDQNLFDIFADAGLGDPSAAAPSPASPSPIAPIAPQTPTPDYGNEPDTTTQPQPGVNFADQYQRDLMDRLKANNPENIYQNKVKEYMKDRGVKDPSSFIGRLTLGLQEAAKAESDRKAGKQYVPLKQRIRDDAQAEFERTSPELQKEANLAFQYLRNAESNKSKEKVQDSKAAVGYRNIQSKEDIAKVRAKLDELVGKAKAGDLEAQAKLRTGQAKLIDNELNDPVRASLRGLPKELQLVIGSALAKDKYGAEHWADMRNDANDVVSSTQKPSDTESYMLTRPQDEFDQWRKDREKDLALKNQGRNIERQTLTKGLMTDADGNLVEQNLNHGNIGGSLSLAGMPPGVQPFDQQLLTNDRKAAQTLTQTDANIGNILNAMSTGDVSQFQGAGEGNAFVKAARDMGLTGDYKSGYEAINDITRNNVTNLHTMFVRGGGRVPSDAVKEMSKYMGSSVSDPQSALAAMLANRYTVELGKLAANGGLKEKEITPQLMKAINSVIEANVARASATGGKAPVRPPSLLDIKKVVDTAVPQKILTGKDRLEALKKNAGQ